MFIKCIPNGMIQSNVYIIANDGEGIIIDCGCKAELIEKVVNQYGLKIKHVILTHGHFDHIYYVNTLREHLDVTVHIHELDAPCMTDPRQSLRADFLSKNATPFKPADHLVADGDILECAGMQFKILHTPGHTRGGICILVENHLFTGDTLFKSSVGRTDFPGGSISELEKSIREKLYCLPDDTLVYPGHGGTTTIGFEKKHNPCIRQE